MQAAGVNPVDCLIREGAFTALPQLPIILGKEVSGIIEAIGPSVNNFSVWVYKYAIIPINKEDFDRK